MKLLLSIASLAWRNLLRNRRRSLTTLLAMTVGVLAVLMFGGFSRNITYGLQTDYVKFGGHLQIQRQGYFLYGSGDPAAYGIVNYRQIIDAVKNDPVLAPMVTVITPTLDLSGIAGNFAAGVSRTALARGVVVDDQNRMREWDDYGFPVRLERLALTGTSAEAAVIGIGMARVLQLCGVLGVRDCAQPPAAADGAGETAKNAPSDIASLAAREGAGRKSDGGGRGARLELLAASARGAPNVAALNVVKAEDQFVKELDDVFVGLHLAQAQRLVYGSDTPRATAVVVQLKHTDQVDAAKARLEQLLRDKFPGEPTDVIDFDTLNPFYGQALAMFGTIFGFIAILISVIVLFTVGNTMSMAVVERTVEIGTLRAMGLRRAGIRRMFICEGLLLGVIGSVLGVALGIALAGLINHSGITWTPPGRSPVPLIIRVWGEKELLFATVSTLIQVAVMSAWWPARSAARLNVVAALRHV